jgi:hypothetical protein
MKLSKTLIAELENALNNLSAGIDYLKNPKTKVCTSMIPHALSYYNKDGQGLTPVNIEAGSDIVRLYKAKSIIENLLSTVNN